MSDYREPISVSSKDPICSASAKVVLKDTREFLFEEIPTHTKEGIFFRKENGEEEVFSSANVLYVHIPEEEYHPLTGLISGWGCHLTFELADSQTMKFEDAQYCGYSGYWFVTDITTHSTYMFPVDSVIRIIKNFRNQDKR